MAAKREAPKAPPVIERFVKALVVTGKAVALYPPSSTIPRDTAAEAADIVREALRERSEVRLVVTKGGLYFEDLPLFADQPAYAAFAFDLYNRRLADVRFHVGIEPSDLVAFLTVLKSSPEEIEASGGFESRLWDAGVATITVSEARVSLVDAQLGDGATAAAETHTRQDIDEILAAAFGGRSRDQLTIARIVSDSGTVKRYLEETYSGDGEAPDLLAVATRFAELAQVGVELGGEARYDALHSLAEALADLDPELRRELLVERILPEARTSESLAEVVRLMDVDAMCRMFVEGLTADDASREGLARAIRNLALISMADREDVLNAAGAAMRAQGFGEGLVGEVLETAAPSRLTVRERAASATAQENPVDAVFRLMDLAPTPSARGVEDDEGVLALREEARRGITDGDVIGALVSLVSLDTRESQFASTMAMLEDSLELLIERGDIDVAADAATALKEAAENPELGPAQRARVTKAIHRFANPSDIRQVARALRLYATDSPEHLAARRLLETLGSLAIDPLLEQLADEPDMAARKALVDLLSEMASQFVLELGGKVTDPRWYFVRNVVSILGSTRSSAVLPFVERTLRHPDARVRRETIRALSSIHDRLAAEMLIAALGDDDAQNVQLAARYLGLSGVRGATGALEQVARGEGRGNRDTGPRVEAIEALGRMGAAEALPTLESLAGRRAIIGASRVRELRAAAESAIAQIREQGGAR